MKKYKFKIGADPELFVIDSNLQPYPAIDLVKGSKENPYNITGSGHSVQVDNVMLEFNIPASHVPEETFLHINLVLNYFKNHLAPKGLSPIIEASMVFDPKHLTSEKAQEFGCDPDFNAWSQTMNDKPNAASNLRTAGGHIHIGYDNPEMEKSLEIVKLFDLYMTIPSLLIDKDERRREMYGKAGAFRFKGYGVECRQLSNFWIKEKSLVKMVFDQVEKVFNHLEEQGPIDSNSELASRIINTINNNDKGSAEQLIKELNIL